jgi:hypothetical protein
MHRSQRFRKFYLESGKQRKATRGQVRQAGCLGHGSHVFGKKKFPSEKESSVATKARCEVSTHFQAVAVKCHSSMPN